MESSIIVVVRVRRRRRSEEEKKKEKKGSKKTLFILSLHRNSSFMSVTFNIYINIQKETYF